MIRLILDGLTSKILGYEDISDYVNIYKDDVVVEYATPNIIGAYYQNGQIVKEDRNDYHAKIAELEEQLMDQIEVLSNKTEKVTKAMLDNTLDNLKIELEKAEEKVNLISKQLKELKEQHDKELEELYLKQDLERDQEVNPKYFSTVCLLIKNENRYLKEWLDHYLDLEFDHIFIYDNGTEEYVSDAIPVWYSKDILQKITVINFTDKHDDLQTECYNHFLEKYGPNSRWVLFVDSDEFLNFPNGIKVNDYLADKQAYTEINIDFTEYGADGQEHYIDKPVKERFTTPVTVNEGMYFKDFIQPSRIDRMETHYPIFNKNKHKTLGRDKNAVVINHYYTKSWEEWNEKMKRGSCDPNYLKNIREFFIYNPDMAYLDHGENEIQPYLNK